MSWLRAAAVSAVVLGAVACSSSSSPGQVGTSPRGASRTASAHSSVVPTASLRVRRAGTFSTGVSRTVAVWWQDHVLMLGGLAAGDVTTSRVVSLDPVSGRSHVIGSLGQAVHDAAGGLVNGVPMVFGGGASTEVSDVQAWQGSRSSVVGHLPVGRSDSAAAVIGNTAYVVGGFDGSHLVRDIVATTDGQHFRVVGRLRAAVRYPAVAVLGGAVWVAGGELAVTEGTNGGPETSAIQRFDPTTGRTTIVGHLPRPMGHAMAFTLGRFLYVAGGRSAGVARDQILRIDPQTGQVRRVGRLPQAESDAAVVEHGSTAWLIGGETTGPLEPQRGVVAISLR